MRHYYVRNAMGWLWSAAAAASLIGGALPIAAMNVVLAILFFSSARKYKPK